ncbi:MAG: F0F1 ATP synthase subunit A [Bacteriovoracaceae bacterium]|nr:F0F1 ATP synthase subunit A [Bacteriovoracaceae bacterium]
MKKMVLALVTSLFSTSALAAGGFTWLGGIAHSLNIPQHTVTFAFVCILFLVGGFIYRAKASSVDTGIVPDKGISFRNIYESIGEFLYDLAKSILGEKDAKKYFTLLITIFLLIFANNLIGIIPGFLPPTDNLNTTLALGLFVFIYYNYQGIKVQGLVGHIKHFLGPIAAMAPLMLIIELISHAVRPISLGLRLKSVMQGDHLVLSIFSDLVPYLIPVPFYALGIFVSFIQAFVFTLLTMIYIGTAVEHHDHDDH